MSKRKGGAEIWLNALRESLEPPESGGFTTHAASLMAAGVGGRRAKCTITKHCRTFVFRFPGSHLVPGASFASHLLYSQDGLKATIVSDLPAYFEHEPPDSVHYPIDVSLRAGVRNTHETATRDSSRAKEPVFLVVEEVADVPPTVLNGGECYEIDEYRDGKPIVEGGRDGEKTLLAIRTTDGAWPDFRPDMHRINIVLAAVKAGEQLTNQIEELYSCSCFVNDKGYAVYTLMPRIGRAKLRVERRIEDRDLRARAHKIKVMLGRMMSDAEPTVLELFDAIVFADSDDDEFLRLQYLRLWQAIEDAGTHLGRSQVFNNDREVIAGGRTPAQLREYRVRIAHWYLGRLDYSYLSDLQHTALELIRTKYGRVSE